jgi:dTMP kinase
MLVDSLRRKGLRVEYTCEPTYGRVGDLIRLHVSRFKVRKPFYEALLFAADRYEHVFREIKPKLRRGVILVSDRYVYSSLAYQGAGGLSLEWVKSINSFAPRPDLIIYLDIPAEKALARKHRIATKRTVFEEVDFQSKVRDLYLKLAEEEKFLKFNGVKPIKTVHREILRKVLRFLEEKDLA